MAGNGVTPITDIGRMLDMTAEQVYNVALIQRLVLVHVHKQAFTKKGQ